MGLSIFCILYRYIDHVNLLFLRSIFKIIMGMFFLKNLALIHLATFRVARSRNLSTFPMQRSFKIVLSGRLFFVKNHGSRGFLTNFFVK